MLHSQKSNFQCVDVLAKKRKRRDSMFEEDRRYNLQCLHTLCVVGMPCRCRQPHEALCPTPN